MSLLVILLASLLNPSTPISDGDFDIVYLDDRIATPDSEIRYDLTAFGSRINLRLRRNSRLLAPNFSAVLVDGNQSSARSVGDCFYLQADDTTAAAVSLCRKNRMEGLVFLANETFEIHPLPSPAWRRGTPHVVRRAVRGAPWSPPRRRRSQAGKRLTIEAALFVDEPAYKIFAPFFDYNDQKLFDMLLAYINGVQALFHHPSLGRAIDIVLVKMEVFKTQPEDLPHFDGERNQLLDSFCLYNHKHNPRGDHDPRHWDMGLYVSGLNFFAYENGRRSEATMGLATVSGVCTDKYNCIIAEFGTTNVFGKPYPSAGFTSVYVLAHEMGHNLGMHHDSTGNDCPKEGYIMSPSRGTDGETVWSACSADAAASAASKCLLDSPESPERQRSLDHGKFSNNPGQVWRAKKQCEMLIRDHDAEVFDPDKPQDICENLRCRTPHRSGFYLAGPALQGTDCGADKWCQGGECVAKSVKPDRVVKGGWSDWQTVGECISGCIRQSKGYQARRRSCDQPKAVNTDEGCEGPGYDVRLCNDDEICDKTRRRTTKEYAAEKCREFGRILRNLDPDAGGLQASHEPGRPWMACTIFCKRMDTEMYYTPRLELNDLGTNPYFPDGTWCHNDGSVDYYCVQHHCLPENFQYTKGGYVRDDDAAFPQIAKPRERMPSPEVLHYLGLDANGKPLSTTLGEDHRKPPQEEEWTDNDYVEIPSAQEYIF